jgi:hypothetical protein
MSNQIDVSLTANTISGENKTLQIGRLKAGVGAFVRLVLLGRGTTALVVDRIDAAFEISSTGVAKVQSVSQDSRLGDTALTVTFAIEPVTYNLSMTFKGVSGQPVSWSVVGSLLIS